MGVISWSKECPDCQRRYPSTCGIATCLACKKELARTEKSPTVDEAEFKDLCFIYGRTIPGPLPDDEREKVEQEWEALEAEAERRAPWFSLADLIGDGFTVRATS